MQLAGLTGRPVSNKRVRKKKKKKEQGNAQAAQERRKKKRKKRRERRKRHGKEEKMWSGINQARGGSWGAQQHVLCSRRTGSACGWLLPGRVSTGKPPASCPRERGPQPLLVLI